MTDKDKQKSRMLHPVIFYKKQKETFRLHTFAITGGKPVF